MKLKKLLALILALALILSSIPLVLAEEGLVIEEPGEEPVRTAFVQVTWNANGGTIKDGASQVSKYETTAIEGSDLAELSSSDHPITPVAKRHFVHWYLSTDSTKSKVTFPYTVGSSNVEFVALWAYEEYTVNWLDDKGAQAETEGGLIPASTVEYGKTPEAPVGTPIKAETAAATFTFDSWPELSVANSTESDVYNYRASFTSTPKEYAIRFLNGNAHGGAPAQEVVIQSGNVEFGKVPTAPETATLQPVDADADHYTYAFKAWTPAVAEVEAARDYVATYESTPNEYTITWITKNENGEVVTDTTKEAYKTVPDPDDPADYTTAEGTYRFDGWDPAIVAVTGDATYTAKYNYSAKTYTITWVDGNGEQITTTDVAYGVVPVYPEQAPVPTKRESAQYTYSFTGWDPVPVAVTGAATYTAQFSGTTRNYKITWYDGNATKIYDEDWAYGTTPAYSKDKAIAAEYAGSEDGTPVKPSSTTKTYTFNSGWIKDGAESAGIDRVTGDTSYTADFDEATRKYTVTWKKAAGDEDPLAVDEYEYNVTPSYIVDDDHPMPTKEATEEYTYSWDGWTEALAPVTVNATYVAHFASTPVEYQVKFVDADGKTAITGGGAVAFGTTLAAVDVNDPEKFTKPEVENLSGWIYVPVGEETVDSFTYSNAAGLDGKALHASMPAHDLVFKASYNPIYTVTFDGNYEDGTTTETTYTVEVKVNEAGDYKVEAIPEAVDEWTRTGYEITGWYIGAEPKTAAEVLDTVFAADTVVKAMWTQKAVVNYTVHFNIGIGTVTTPIADQVIEEGKFLTDVESPVLEGATFVGWWYAEGEEKVFIPKAELTTKPITKNLTLNARYEVVLSIDLDGGELDGSDEYPKTLSLDGATVVIGDNMPGTPIKNGYTFDGWYKNGTLVTSETEINADTEIKAKWYGSWTLAVAEGETYGDLSEDGTKVRFAGSIDDPMTRVYDNVKDAWIFKAAVTAPSEDVKATAKVSVGEHNYLDSEAIPASDFNGLVYTLCAEVELADVVAALADGKDGTIEFAWTLFNDDDDKNGQVFKIIVDVRNVELSAGESEANPAAKVVDGELYEYTLKFNVTDAENVSEDWRDQIVAWSKKAEKPATNPQKTGFTFLGWVVNATDENEFDFNTALSNQEDLLDENRTITLIPKWGSGQWNVTNDSIKPEAGIYSAVEGSLVFSGDATAPLAPIVNDSDDFCVSWEFVSPDAISMADAANWDVYMNGTWINLADLDDTTSDAQGRVIVPITLNLNMNEMVTIAANAGAVKEYVFRFAPKTLHSAYQEIKVSIDPHNMIFGKKDAELYILKIKDGVPCYQVKFALAGGEAAEESVETYDPKDVPVNTKVAVDNPVKTGYRFDGWMNGEDPFDPVTDDVTESITLTAQWGELEGYWNFTLYLSEDDVKPVKECRLADGTTKEAITGMLLAVEDELKELIGTEVNVWVDESDIPFNSYVDEWKLTKDLTLFGKNGNSEVLPILYGASADLQGKIKMRFAFKLPDDVTPATCGLSVKLGDKATIAFKDAAYDAGIGAYIFVCDTPILEYKDEISISVIDNEGNPVQFLYKTQIEPCDSYAYSLAKYVENMKAKATGKQLTLVKALEVYAKAALHRFKGGEAIEVTADLSGLPDVVVPAELPSGITRIARSATVDADNSLVFGVFLEEEGTVGKYTFTPPAGAKMEVSGNLIRFTVPNIASNMLGTEYTLSVSDGTVTATTTASILSYLKNVLGKYTNGTDELAKALYLYYLAAKDYFPVN